MRQSERMKRPDILQHIRKILGLPIRNKHTYSPFSRKELLELLNAVVFLVNDRDALIKEIEEMSQLVKQGIVEEFTNGSNIKEPPSL